MRMTVAESFARFANSRIVEVREPKPGFRHQRARRLVWHRFPVKGGVTPLDALTLMIFAPSNKPLSPSMRRRIVAHATERGWTTQ